MKNIQITRLQYAKQLYYNNVLLLCFGSIQNNKITNEHNYNYQQKANLYKTKWLIFRFIYTREFCVPYPCRSF